MKRRWLTAASAAPPQRVAAVAHKPREQHAAEHRHLKQCVRCVGGGVRLQQARGHGGHDVGDGEQDDDGSCGD